MKTSAFSCRAAIDLRDVAQTRELAAVLLSPRAVAEPLRWMVADLLQPHEKGQDDAPALHSIDVFELAGQLFHCLLVKRRLLAAQGAEGFHLGLVGQVGNDALVGLQASQDIGAHQVAERTVRVMRPVGEAFDEGRKLLRRSQQSRIDEVEDRPQVAEPILDRRAGQRNARFGLELLDRFGLLGGRVLDGLRFVEHHQSPWCSFEPRRTRQKAVARDDEIDIRQIVRTVHVSISRPAQPMDGPRPL